MGHTGNILAIVTAAVVAWLFGGAYYTALNGPWLKAMGKTLEQCKAEQAAKSALANAAPFVLAFIGELIMAWAIYGILFHLNMFSVRAGAITGAVCWFGFVLTTVTVNYAFAGRKVMLTVIDAIGWLGAMLIIGAIIGWFGP
ncbi:MAG: DUF1761 domain-containing protein [Xanthobacteraceae bacterium]|nr:DUF1761 domain-containing protein [Xanthobacteraceae bacterium]